MTDNKISPAGDRWEDYRKEKYSPEVRRVLDKEIAQISKEINKSNR